jgi:hypothetical protein
MLAMVLSDLCRWVPAALDGLMAHERARVM